MKQTAEQRAEERWPKTPPHMHGAVFTHMYQREGFATCIREEVEPLEAWKESAIKVMGEWDKVHEALGKPGKLGESMAASSLAEVAKLRALVQVLVDQHGEVKWDSEQCDWTCEQCGNDYRMKQTDLYNSACKAIAAAKEQGFVPTNTTEG